MCLWVPDLTCDFCMQNSVISIRITILYGSQASCLVFGCKTATLWPDLQVCMGPRPHLRFWALKTACLATRIESLYGFQFSPVVLCMQNSAFSTWITSLYWYQPSSDVFEWKPATFGPKLHVSMGPSTHLWFSTCKTACLASELKVSMDSNPYLWFLHAKQRLLEQNYMSLWVPDLMCDYLHAKRRA